MGDPLQTRGLGRLVTPLAGDDLILAVVRAHQNRLQHTLLFHRHDHLGQVAEVLSRLMGIRHDPPDVDEETYARVTGVNTDAAFWLCGAVLPIMREQGYGRIVLTTSGWALGPFKGSDNLILYCHGKGAQFGLAMALAEGSGHPGILTNILAPIANTRMYSVAVVEGRLRPESVAGAATWLASPAWLTV